ncbi:NAD(P)/FAD-dependent oxidoreductase [Spirillospora sp. NPDC048911]|uniref:NAD(P)/FAD-dependent oxidoreductase n=1 Tax=Spirillospora sp. NPDC048911 TaxID=3364527 RepID=UPI0037193D77
MSERILVIGGGPAGSTAAALLARAGRDVLLLERAVFPRYHIGESLLLSCVPVLHASGAYDRVAKHGFQVKRGSVFRWGTDAWVIDWPNMVHPDAHSWQVHRAEFDHELLRNAADQGAKIVEGATVKRIVFEDGRAVAAEWVHRDDPENVRVTEFDFLVDASGRTGVLTKGHFDNRQQHDVFQNVATWSYWKDAEILAGSPEGSVNSISTDGGWFWVIPLAGGEISIGHVTHKDLFAEERPKFASLQEYYLHQIRSCETLDPIVEGATQVEDVRAEQDYSYVADAFSGPGYVAIGDAACFLDPLLSTGVHLALYSALTGAAAVNSALNGDLSEEEALSFFEYAYRRAYARLITLVSHLYQRYDGKDSYFWQAQRLVLADHADRPPIHSFMEIISGNTDMREVSDVSTRIMTDELIVAADQAQRTAGEHRVSGTLGVDMQPLRDLWADPSDPSRLSADLDGVYVTTDPVLGLARAPKPQTSNGNGAEAHASNVGGVPKEAKA